MFLLTSIFLSIGTPSITATAQVVDIKDGFPISGAMVYNSTDTTYTDINGFFNLPTNGDENLTIKAISYNEVSICPSDCDGKVEMISSKPANIYIRSSKKD